MLESEVVDVIVSEMKAAATLNKLPAFVFDRVSNLDEESHSLEFQGARSRRYVTEAGLHSVYHFSVTESGWKSAARRQFKQMLDISEKFGIQNLVFKNTDRLSRNLRDLLRIQELIEKKGYRIHFFENYKVIEKSSTYDDKWTLELLILLAKRHSDKISHDISASNKYKLEKGIAPGPARHGYVYDKEQRRHVINKATEAQLRWIFDEFDTLKYSIKSFCELLNGNGVKSITGRKWYPSLMHTFLTTPFYHGEIYIKQTDTIHPGNQETFYDKDRYDRRVKFLTGRFAPRAGKPTDFLLEHLVKCDCGAAYYADIKKGKYVYYAHACKISGKTERVSEGNLVAEIDRHIQSITFDERSIELLKDAFKGRIKERADSNEDDLREVSNRLIDINRRKSRLLELYTEDGIDKHDLLTKMKDFDRQVSELRKQESAMVKDHRQFTYQILDVIERFRNFTRIYAESTPTHKASILREAVETVNRTGQVIRFAMKDAVQILYKYEPELRAELARSSSLSTDVATEGCFSNSLLDRMALDFRLAMMAA